MTTSGKRQRAAAVLVVAVAALAACGGRDDDRSHLAAAQAHYAKRDLGSTVIEAKTALQRNPANADARLLLGRALLDGGNAASAVVELRKALEAGAADTAAVPLLASAMLSAGEAQSVVLQFAQTQLAAPAAQAALQTTLAAALSQQHDRAGALEAVQRALQTDPTHAPAQLLQARLMAADGDTRRALEIVDSVVERNPHDVGALLLGGDLRGAIGDDTEGALARYRKAAEAEPRAVPAHVAVIETLLRRGDIDGAKSQFEKMKAALPSNPETKLLETRFALSAHDYAKTRELAQQLLKSNPNDPRVLQLAAAAEMRFDSMLMAENYLSQAVKAAPRSAVTRRMLADVYLRTQRPMKALEALGPLIAGDKADAGSLTLAGQAWAQAGDSAKAEQAFTRAVKADPKATTARAALALGQIAKGRTAAGFAELEAASAADSGADADLALVGARLQAGDAAGALRALDALEKKQPAQALVHTLRGRLLARAGDTAGAEASYRKALAITPNDVAAAGGLAELDIAAGKPDAARERFEALLRGDPKNPRALLALAQVKARTGAPPSEVRQQIGAAVAANPTAVLPRLVLVDHLLGQGDVPAALATARDAVAAIPGNARLQERLAATQLAASQPQQAVATYAQLAAAQPDAVKAQLRLAQAQLAANDSDAAERTLARAAELDPGNVAAQLGQAQVALMHKRPDRAIEIARALQRRQPKLAAGYLLEAEIETQRGQPAAAAAALRRLTPDSSETAMRLHAAFGAAGQAGDADRLAAAWVKDHPKDADFRYHLADLALARRDLAQAETQYRAVLAIQPDHALALNNIAWLMARQNKPGAVALAERANRLLPETPALMDTLALALVSEHQGERALEVQKKAVQARPGDAGLKLTLAKVYIELGDRKQARNELEALARQGDRLPLQAEVTTLLKAL